ncbi:MAG: CbtB-domain containing protein [Actinobacteria bacterium]|nr:CbtB-domain containing protein [Actinomycetota bacterium]MBW3651793.1 CbtB-domain containing protein [Actinomycetota bacterium]
MDDTVAVERIRVPAWAMLAVALAAFAIYALTLENGLLLGAHAERLHELFHDARHFVGVPCH